MTSGQRIVEIALEHVGETYRQQQPVPKDHSGWKGPWDCSEFASWCLFQATGVLYGCADNSAPPAVADSYTGYWARDARKRGNIVTVLEAANILGAFLLREPPEVGKQGHIAITDGLGGTVEAHSIKEGVTRKRVSGRRWDYGVLVPGVLYQSMTVVANLEVPQRAGFVLRLKKPRISGEIVRNVQRALLELGYQPGATDGVYGPQTAAAVVSFQGDKRLAEDGEVGLLTAAALKVNWPK